ncbi:MAG: tRNA(Ile)-lysidine synthase [Methanoregula sp.]|uniref:tRNA(Ile)-lysidine synthase n=1 Tax=Methanoregula sp. TaxID=2052170 RepID=UPI003BB03BB2
MQCDACRREAVVFQPYSGKHLCPVHFTRDLEAKAKRTIRTHGWLRPGDHIAVASSGDAPSAALLSFLFHLTANRRDVRLSAITVDPGITGYPVAEQAGTIAGACGVPWFSGSFAERYSVTMDKLMRQEGQESACRSCRVLAGDLIGEIAAAQCVTRCAFATSVDEIAEAFFTDLITGSVEHTLFPRHFVGRSGIPVIRPFMEIPAAEVARYAELHATSAVPCGFLPSCPCTVGSSRAADARAALDVYDHRHPATKFALANLAGTLAGIAAGFDPAPVCPACGSPLSGGKCEGCGIRRNTGRGTLA